MVESTVARLFGSCSNPPKVGSSNLQLAVFALCLCVKICLSQHSSQTRLTRSLSPLTSRLLNCFFSPPLGVSYGWEKSGWIVSFILTTFIGRVRCGRSRFSSSVVFNNTFCPSSRLSHPTVVTVLECVIECYPIDYIIWIYRVSL